MDWLNNPPLVHLRVLVYAEYVANILIKPKTIIYRSRPYNNSFVTASHLGLVGIERLPMLLFRTLDADCARSRLMFTVKLYQPIDHRYQYR